MMKANLSHLNIDQELERTQEAQFKASDPRSSVWVSANAGTGKTHVLTMRVLRLLLSGTEPERILCLTYTRAAATEMSKRVFSELARFVGLDDLSLHKALFTYLLREPTSEEKNRARTLFTQSIETPGGFKAQTIHAFSERLLQRFPLEAGVTPGFKILEDTETKKLKQRAINKILEAGLRAPSAPLGKALSIAVSYTTETGFEHILSEALRYHEWLGETFGDTFDNTSKIQTRIKILKKQLKKHFKLKMDGEESKISEIFREKFSSMNWAEHAKL
ncbi:MAG: UvrD-helicase domain-containing protein, partial [Hyphomicrobium sp.]